MSRQLRGCPLARIIKSPSPFIILMTFAGVCKPWNRSPPILLAIIFMRSSRHPLWEPSVNLFAEPL
jgi:hypothetical protein